MDIHNTSFSDCNLESVDFSESNLKSCQFNSCDFKNATFYRTNLQHAYLYSSYNFILDPSQNDLTKAVFSAENCKGLLHPFKVIIKP